jgi:hypothetical protein
MEAVMTDKMEKFGSFLLYLAVATMNVAGVLSYVRTPPDMNFITASQWTDFFAGFVVCVTILTLVEAYLAFKNTK